ncbi:MAG: SLC13 family permease [Tepidisphaerales bacterium]
MGRWIALAASGLAGAAAYFLAPADLGEPARRALVIFVVAALFWATEVVPLYATSLGVVVASVWLLAGDIGLPNPPGPDGVLKARLFLDPLASNVILLFLGGLILSAAVSRHGLDQAISARVLAPFIDRPLLLIYAVLGSTAFFSMWMSNTATAAMMLAILGPVLQRLEGRGRLAAAVALAVPIGANLGGIGTPVGTPPNAIALAALRSAGFDISFLRWMLMAVPLMTLLLLIGGLLLYLMFGRGGPLAKPLEPSVAAPTPALAASAPLTPRGWATLVVLLAAILAWLTGEWHGVPDGIIALTTAAVLTVTGLATRDDVRNIEWSVLLLMWGGLTLGLAMQHTGLLGLLGELPLAHVRGPLLAGMVVLAAMFVSTFISNTATAALLTPVVLAFALPERGQLVVLGALGCSFALALPVSTPPNALAYATGRFSTADMLRAGGLLSLIAVLVSLVGYPLMLPLALPVR